MSWTLSVTAPRAEFESVLDHARPGGQDDPGVAEVVAVAKMVAKTLAGQLRRDYISAQLSGHVLQPDQGPNWADSITVTLYGSEPPA